MYNFNKIISIAKGVLTSGVFALAIFAHAENNEKKEIAANPQKQILDKESYESWKKFHSVSGKCIIAFPAAPEHVKQTMTLEEDEYDMQYDVYVATEQNRQAVYMVLIAQYPSYVNESYAELSLESFLNGILTQHPNNQLVFADLTEVHGHKAMDFFIKTKGVYFKGRAIMAGSNLYLLAMECEGENFKEKHYNFFINSFEFTK